ncbi:MAG TPA: hypothetical protein VFQ62_09205 [Methylomirabilota bacterium]|jgi:hypothetical protein|nr:hypothetical protein [Methylomirabilota bacterium]
MKLAFLLIASLSGLAFAGCVLKGPELRVGSPVEVTVDGDNNGNGKFCPPGQAKKGRC